MNIICFGFGQVAKNFIKKLHNQWISLKLTTTSREDSKEKKFENINYKSFQFTEKGFDKNFKCGGCRKKNVYKKNVYKETDHELAVVIAYSLIHC